MFLSHISLSLPQQSKQRASLKLIASPYCRLKLKCYNFTSFLYPIYLKFFFFLSSTLPHYHLPYIFLSFSVPLSVGIPMRPDQLSRNPLDLNNFPEDYGSNRDGKQTLEESSTTITEASSETTTRFRKKRSGGGGGKDGGGKEECGKVYECRFCSLKFCKSQALGGHMNRHRQERETETLNRARQLVFSNENIAAQGCPHIGIRDPILGGVRPMPPGSFHQGGNIGGGGDPSSLPFRPVYPSRIFSGTSSTILSNPPPPPHQPFLYTSSSSSSPSSRLVSFPSSHYPPPPQPHPHHNNHHLVNDYLINRVGNESTNYTCIGAPVGHSFSHEDITRRGGGGINAFPAPPVPSSRGGGVDSGSNLQNQEHQDGLNWNNHSYPRSQQHMDSSSSSINRFQDGLL